MAFTHKAIECEFSLASGQFSGSNSHTTSGLRTSVTIVNAGAPSMGELEAVIFGMTQSEMNALTTLGNNLDQYGNNKISVRAGDAGTALSLTFQGTITAAFCDATAQPEVCFRVKAYAASFESVKPVQPTSVQGAAQVSDLMKQIVGKMQGFTFENGGVSGLNLNNPYLGGTAREQAEELARQAGIEIDISLNNVAIWPSGQARSGDATVISPATGLVSYPSFTSSGIIFSTLYNPTLKRGGQITMQSGLQPACGNWFVNNITHQLESEMPHGKWFTVIEAGRIHVSDTPSS